MLGEVTEVTAQQSLLLATALEARFICMQTLKGLAQWWLACQKPLL